MTQQFNEREKALLCIDFLIVSHTIIQCIFSQTETHQAVQLSINFLSFIKQFSVFSIQYSVWLEFNLYVYFNVPKCNNCREIEQRKIKWLILWKVSSFTFVFYEQSLWYVLWFPFFVWVILAKFVHWFLLINVFVFLHVKLSAKVGKGWTDRQNAPILNISFCFKCHIGFIINKIHYLCGRCLYLCFLI